jgi:hypothetical protein
LSGSIDQRAQKEDRCIACAVFLSKINRLERGCTGSQTLVVQRLGWKVEKSL